MPRCGGPTWRTLHGPTAARNRLLCRVAEARHGGHYTALLDSTKDLSSQLRFRLNQRPNMADPPLPYCNKRAAVVSRCVAPKYRTLHCPTTTGLFLYSLVRLPLKSVAKDGGQSIALLRHVRSCSAEQWCPKWQDTTLPYYYTPVPFLLSSASNLTNGKRWRTLHGPSAARVS